MQVTNEFGTRRIGLIKVESVQDDYPSHRVRVEIETENIKTNFDNHIWLDETDIEIFLKDLERLDSNRTGKASLESIGSGDLRLIFQAVDILGHLSVTCSYRKDDKEAKDYSCDVTVEFQIDPTSLQTVRNEFLALIK